MGIDTGKSKNINENVETDAGNKEDLEHKELRNNSKDRCG